MGHNNIDWCHKETKNKARGIMCKCHKNKFSYERYIIGKGNMVVVGQYSKDNNQNIVLIIVMNVYSLCDTTEKYVMWEEITGIKLAEECKVVVHTR